MVSAGPIAQAVPKIRHVHITQDISLFYTIEGRNPTVIKLYGLFTHAESGTSNTAKIKQQKSFAQRLKNIT
jgi:hypothetical protein